MAEPNATQTTRERFDVHSAGRLRDRLPPAPGPDRASPSSRYDAIGTYRTTDRNKPVDTTGSLTLPSGTPLSVQERASSW